MNQPVPNLRPPPPLRKNVLLIDTRTVKRDVRAKLMRDRGLHVDFADLIPKARALWTLNRYDLVLMDFRNDSGKGMELYEEMKGTHPAQKIAFFVGKPLHWAFSPVADCAQPAREEFAPSPEGKAALALLLTQACEALPFRGGVREATLRIAAARSLREGAGKKTAVAEPWISFADAVLQQSAATRSSKTEKQEANLAGDPPVNSAARTRVQSAVV